MAVITTCYSQFINNPAQRIKVRHAQPLWTRHSSYMLLHTGAPVLSHYLSPYPSCLPYLQHKVYRSLPLPSSLLVAPATNAVAWTCIGKQRRAGITPRRLTSLQPLFGCYVIRLHCLAPPPASPSVRVWTALAFPTTNARARFANDERHRSGAPPLFYRLHCVLRRRHAVRVRRHVFRWRRGRFYLLRYPFCRNSVCLYCLYINVSPLLSPHTSIYLTPLFAAT